MRYSLAALGLILLALSACDIAEPHLPAWDVDFTIPLMNERFLVSELADSLDITIGDGDVLTLVNTGQAETPDFGHVNFTPGNIVNDIPLFAGENINLTLPLVDPTGTVFLSYGEFTQGYLRYQFDVVDPANTVAQMTLPDVVNDQGLPLQIQNNQFGSWQSFNLPDYHLGIKDSGLFQDSLRFVFSVQSDLPAGTPIGSVSLDLNNQFGFRVFQGYLYSYVRALEGVVSTIEIAYPFEIDEAIQLQQADIYIEVTNEVGFGAAFPGFIRSSNHRTGEVRVISVVDDEGNYFTVNPATAMGSTITQLDFSSNVSQILQIMPDTVEIFDSFLLINGGSNGNAGFVEEHNRIYCSYQIHAPFTFETFDHSFTRSEVTEVEISEESSDLITDSVLEAELTLEVVNRIPLGAAATVYIGTTPEIDPAQTASYAFSRTITLHSSQYTGPDVNQDGEQEIQLALSEAEIGVFDNPMLYLLWTFTFEPSNGPVTITASPADYIQVKGMLRAKLHVEENS